MKRLSRSQRHSYKRLFVLVQSMLHLAKNKKRKSNTCKKAIRKNCWALFCKKYPKYSNTFCLVLISPKEIMFLKGKHKTSVYLSLSLYTLLQKSDVHCELYNMKVAEDILLPLYNHYPLLTYLPWDFTEDNTHSSQIKRSLRMVSI